MLQDPILTIFKTLFTTVFRPPHTKLTIPYHKRPSKFLVFVLAIVSYFLVMSGVVYDMINEPPSIGQTREGNRIKPVLIMQYRVNGQYIMEGFSAGFLFTLGGLGILALDWASNNETLSNKNRYILMGIAAGVFFIAYNVCISFLKLKIPGYLQV
eukprot:GEZU01005370.1.p1 GENE.GEZU01005370.1~~GEZU01005370.1.p1  ORF type:complete len:155 (-),score=41.24 GEZU01005370.1:744-1208(-)